ncbi:hypothetical protein C6A37_03025 [Desulfobacteraceae bacterium SEEP-SAG9]|nr:hypothetical protein C6A37_03025 [Desulfobacteraceae bacterium SEEP-SAG9]
MAPRAYRNILRRYQAFGKQRGIIYLPERYRQYMDSLKNNRAFQKRYMVPAEIGKGQKTIMVDQDEGIKERKNYGIHGSI